MGGRLQTEKGTLASVCCVHPPSNHKLDCLQVSGQCFGLGEYDRPNADSARAWQPGCLWLPTPALNDTGSLQSCLLQLCLCGLPTGTGRNWEYLCLLVLGVVYLLFNQGSFLSTTYRELGQEMGTEGFRWILCLHQSIHCHFKKHTLGLQVFV